MKILNPNTPSTITATDKTNLQNALVALASNASPTFDEVRAALPADQQSRFTDGFMHEVALVLGLSVQGD